MRQIDETVPLGSSEGSTDWWKALWKLLVNAQNSSSSTTPPAAASPIDLRGQFPLMPMMESTLLPQPSPSPSTMTEFYMPLPMASPRVATSDRTPKSRSMPPLGAWHSTMSERSSMPSPLFVDDQVLLLHLTSPSRSTPQRPLTNWRK
jgi:hypothetical protein